jgi:hypothetical protein
MKNLTYIYLFVFISFFASSQEFDEKYIVPNDTDTYVSIYLKFDNLLESKKHSISSSVNNVFEEKSKKARTKINYFGFKISHNEVIYEKNKKTTLGVLDSVYVSNGSLYFEMSELNGDSLMFCILHDSNRNVLSVITKTKKNGKKNICFSKQCTLSRSSI